MGWCSSVSLAFIVVIKVLIRWLTVLTMKCIRDWRSLLLNKRPIETETCQVLYHFNTQITYINNDAGSNALLHFFFQITGLSHFFFCFLTDSMNSILIAIITTSFICFGIFIVVLILLKMVQIYRRRKKQSKEAGREEMAMLHYRQKSFRSGNNNEEELDLNT